MVIRSLPMTSCILFVWFISDDAADKENLIFFCNFRNSILIAEGNLILLSTFSNFGDWNLSGDNK